MQTTRILRRTTDMTTTELVLTGDDEWHGFDCHGVEIDTNSGTWEADGTVTFVLYVRPKHLPETPETPHVTDAQWCVGVIRVPLDLILQSAEPEHIIQAIQQRGN
jgi:hypothetical protein